VKVALSLLALCLCTGLGAGALIRDSQQGPERLALTEESEQIRLIELHFDFAGGVLERLNQEVEAELGLEGHAVETPSEQSIAGVRSGLGELTEISRANEPWRDGLAGLLDEAEGTPQSDFVGNFDLHLDAVADAVETPVLTSEVRSFVELRELAAVPTYLRNVALDYQILIGEVASTSGNEEYWDIAETLGEFGGSQLGDIDEPLPLWVLPVENPSEDTAAIGEAFVDSGVHSYDQWLGDTDGPGPGEPPLSYAEYSERLEALSIQFGSISDAAGEARLDELDEMLGVLDGRSQRLHLFAASCFAAAALLLAWLVATALRRRRALKDEIETDPLTGVGNRRVLDTVLVANMAMSDLTHHAIGVIDLDRFKIINDSWGHAAGDAVLVEVARRLETVLGRWRSDGSSRRTTLARQGGDEFVFGLHAPAEIDLATARALVRTAVDGPVAVLGGQVEVSISIGLSTCAQVSEVASSIASADLAAYEDKARKQSALSPRIAG